MEMLTKIIIGAMFVEAVVEYISAAFSKDFHPKCLMSISLGAAFAIFYRLDLLAVFGLTTQVPVAGMVLTGILLSRGSNFISDFIKRLGGGND